MSLDGRQTWQQQPGAGFPAPRRAEVPERFRWAQPLVLRVLVGALVAGALVGVVAALTGGYTELAGRALSTIAISAIVALLVWWDAEVSARRSETFALASLAVSGYLIVLGVVEVWVPRADDGGTWTSEDHGFWTWALLALIARVALLHVHLLLNVYDRFRTPGMRLLSRVTFGLVAILVVLLSVPVITDGGQGDLYWRITAAVAILDATGTILIPLVHVLFNPRARTPQWQLAGPPPQRPAWAPDPAPQPPAAASAPVVASPPARQGPASGRDLPPPPAAVPGAVEDPSRFAYGPPALRKLAWPRYEDGTPLPVGPDGAPDFSGVALR